MSEETTVDALLLRYVEHHVMHGTRLVLEELCAGRPDQLAELRRQVDRYERLDATLDAGGPQVTSPRASPSPSPSPLPTFPGFRTIERLGAGGMGEVYKAQDLRLDRLVAVKTIRTDAAIPASLEDFLREARSLALFSDPRIVQVHEVRVDAEPPFIVMELVDGFPLMQVAPSLEMSQRARIVAETCEALHHAHVLGITHRDIKPGNLLLDKRLSPKVLDFGLAHRDPSRGHGLGTLSHLAPEQLDESKPIDARTDVYALGVILYEVLCGALPHDGDRAEDVIAAINAGRPRLPMEVDPSVPEPLQAIALKAMERDPALRYQTAREMAHELRRFIAGKPVLARPSLYASALERRIRPHLQQLAEWRRLKLVFPHEAERIHSAYRQLENRDDDWIVQSRSLTFSQIALYLGAFLVACGSAYYFAARRMFAAGHGLVAPLLALGLPLLALAITARTLHRGGSYRAVAVAYYLAGVLVVPLLLLVALGEGSLLAAVDGAREQLLGTPAVSDRQLQVSLAVGAAWALALALHTRTVALSSAFTVLSFAAYVAVLGEIGLRSFIEDGAWDRVAWWLTPLLLATALGAWLLDARRVSFLARPLAIGGAVLLVGILELLALDGRELGALGVTLSGLSGPDVSDPTLLPTLAAMALNGIVFYGVAWVLDRRGTDVGRLAAGFLFAISPFAVLEPLAVLNRVEDYSKVFEWLYLGLALAITFASHFRQRRSFYYAGLVNTGIALWLIADRYEWFDRQAWAVAIVLAGLAALAGGLALHAHERRRSGTQAGD